MQHQRNESNSFLRQTLAAERDEDAQSVTRSPALRALLAFGLSLCGCAGSGDKPRDAAQSPAPKTAVDSAASDAAAAADAATAEPTPSRKQIIKVTPGQAAGRIALGLTLPTLESLADWSKEQMDGGTLSLRMSPWHVLVKDGIATEMTFTLEPGILPVVANRTVPDPSNLSELAKLFPDCQAPTSAGGLDVISCQEGRTRLEKQGVDGNVVVRFVSAPPAKRKAKRGATK